MKALRAAHRLGGVVSARRTRERREAARAIVSGAASWSLLLLARDLASSSGAPVSTAPARVGTSPTAAGAARPAADGGDLVFVGAQKLAAATGLLGGLTGATVLVVVDIADATTGAIFSYGYPYYNGRRLLFSVPSAGHVACCHGESGLGDRNTEFFAVEDGSRALCGSFDRTQTGAAELACYDKGGELSPNAANTNDCTSTYAASQTTAIGAYGDGSFGVTMRLRALGIIPTTSTPDVARRLARLLAAACEVA